VISPDGRWLAYVSNESGTNQVFMAPLSISASTRLPETNGAAMLVSRGAGVAPRWRADSRELFYQSPSGSVMSVVVTGRDIARPVELFQAPGMLTHWGVASDGQRFLVAVPVKPSAQVPFGVVLNWQSTLSNR
jgi:hypothetical protein